jgi:hypothetical protein
VVVLFLGRYLNLTRNKCRYFGSNLYRIYIVVEIHLKLPFLKYIYIFVFSRIYILL